MPTAATKFDVRVDAYIAKSQPFAQPILEHLRDIIFDAVPGIEETMKWSMPFYVYDGIILCNMAGFKQHCAFSIWKSGGPPPTAAPDKKTEGSGMGNFGKLTLLTDLPAKAELKKMLQEAAKNIYTGVRTKNWERPAAKKKAPPAPEEVPPAFAEALKKCKPAATHFKAMSSSCQREYCQWIAGAKRDETRTSRVAQAIEWISEGKKRNWKYESC